MQPFNCSCFTGHPVAWVAEALLVAWMQVHSMDRLGGCPIKHELTTKSAFSGTAQRTLRIWALLALLLQLPYGFRCSTSWAIPDAQIPPDRQFLSLLDPFWTPFGSVWPFSHGRLEVRLSWEISVQEIGASDSQVVAALAKAWDAHHISASVHHRPIHGLHGIGMPWNARIIMDHIDFI